MHFFQRYFNSISTELNIQHTQYGCIPSAHNCKTTLIWIRNLRNMKCSRILAFSTRVPEDSGYPNLKRLRSLQGQALECGSQEIPPQLLFLPRLHEPRPQEASAHPESKQNLHLSATGVCVCVCVAGDRIWESDTWEKYASRAVILEGEGEGEGGIRRARRAGER